MVMARQLLKGWGWHPARSGPGKCVWAEFAIQP
jgi:hypothetical protein